MSTPPPLAAFRRPPRLPSVLKQGAKRSPLKRTSAWWRTISAR